MSGKSPGEPPINRKVESHSSYLTNVEIHRLFGLVDKLAITASNSMHISSINAYYNAVEQTYLNMTGLIPDNDVEDIENMRTMYARILELIESDPRCRTRKAVRSLLKIAREFNFRLRKGPQMQEYFFRMGIKKTKGLDSIRFFNKNSIFSKSKKKNGTAED